QPVVCSVVVGIDFQTAAERGGRGRHVAAMVVRDAEVVMAEYEAGSQGYGLLVISHRLVERALMKMQVAEQMVRKYVFRIGYQQTLKLPARFLAATVALMHQGKE